MQNQELMYAQNVARSVMFQQDSSVHNPSNENLHLQAVPLMSAYLHATSTTELIGPWLVRGATFVPFRQNQFD